MRKNAYNKIWTKSPRQKGPKANHLDLLNTFSSVGFRLLHLQLLPYTSAKGAWKTKPWKGKGSPTHSSLSTCRSPGMYGFIGSISQSAAMPEFLSSTPGNIALQSHLELLHLAPEDFIGLKKQINKFGSWKHGLLNILISYLVSSQRFWHQHRFENPEPLRSTYTLQALHSISAFRISASGWVWLFKRLQETFVQFHHSKSIPPNTKPIHGTKL